MMQLLIVCEMVEPGHENCRLTGTLHVKRKGMETMGKRLACWSVMAFLPLAAITYLFYCLETYNLVVHNDSGFAVQALSLFFMLVEFILWRKKRKQYRAYTVIAVISTFLLAAVFYVGGKIPFCVECDRITAEDLGFLQYWIQPMGS